jgi:hypothetical protein
MSYSDSQKTYNDLLGKYLADEKTPGISLLLKNLENLGKKKSYKTGHNSLYPFIEDYLKNRDDNERY